MTEADPFAGWEMRPVGCYWTRPIGDGRKATLSTWSRGGEGGYALTVDRVETQFPDLDGALAAYDELAAAAAR